MGCEVFGRRRRRVERLLQFVVALPEQIDPGGERRDGGHSQANGVGGHGSVQEPLSGCRRLENLDETNQLTGELRERPKRLRHHEHEPAHRAD